MRNAWLRWQLVSTSTSKTISPLHSGRKDSQATFADSAATVLSLRRKPPGPFVLDETPGESRPAGRCWGGTRLKGTTGIERQQNAGQGDAIA